MARLNDEDRALALSLYKRGSSPTKIGEMLGCSKSTVAQIARMAGVPLQHPEQARRRAVEPEQEAAPVTDPEQICFDLGTERLTDQEWRDEVLALLRRLVRSMEASA